jgi:hypothetical protein
LRFASAAKGAGRRAIIFIFVKKKRVRSLTRRDTALRHAGVVLAYCEEAGEIGLDAERDRAAKLRALERGGYTRAVSEKARLRKFSQIWNGDAARELLAQTWGFAVPEAPDPLAVMQRTLYEHMTQRDESWGPRDRSASLAAVAQAGKMFVPQQTVRVDSRSVVARVDRPLGLDEPKMVARTLGVEAPVVAKAVAADAVAADAGDDDEDEEEEDDE